MGETLKGPDCDRPAQVNSFAWTAAHQLVICHNVTVNRQDTVDLQVASLDLLQQVGRERVEILSARVVLLPGAILR